MEYRFYLDGAEVEEPIGWADFELSLQRDPTFHGMQFEASSGTLQFYGDGAVYLQGVKENQGASAIVVFRVELICDGEPDEEITAVLNMGKYKKTCGNQCLVSVPVEEQSCAIQFKSRFDQKVDLDSLLAFDKATILPNYANMGEEIVIPPKALRAEVNGAVVEEDDIVDTGVLDIFLASFVYTRPTYGVEVFNSIRTGNLIPTQSWEHFSGGPGLSFPISPQFLFEDDIRCFTGSFDYDIDDRGFYTITGDPTITLQSVSRRLILWDGNGDLLTNGTIIDEVVVATPAAPLPFGGSFDVISSGTISIPFGIGLYSVMNFELTGGLGEPFQVIVNYGSDSHFILTATKLCGQNTPVESYLVHETLSRVVESVTNRCMRVKSEYYGRIDSQPFAFPEDGCGSLRMLTSGLKIRRALEGKFFASPKDLLEGLRAIDNIGFGIETDPEMEAGWLLRVEELDYFYTEDELLRLDFIPLATEEVQESMHYSRILIGYKKWEVEQVNGLEEYNSNREYRTSLSTISNTLDATSALVAGGYPIEITRQQGFSDSGAADTRYDNDIFIICLVRNAYDFTVEQGGITDPVNIFDPATTLNFRLTPLRNLMRWYKSIAPSYAVPSNTTNKLFFTEGKGNITAAGMLTDPTCRLENGVITENKDLFITNFADQAKAFPIWKPETITFEYPMSVADYKAVKEKPYGYISIQCGTGAYEKAYIKEIKYRPAKGTATFTLIKKYAV